ncbi:hypothetical protein [Halospeciosus flavus]|uniref:hypothetical protein n=1 Tax=Halospeciosus flavus TaxID=3032283 RepID=UPI003618A217
MNRIATSSNAPDPISESAVYRVFRPGYDEIGYGVDCCPVGNLDYDDKNRTTATDYEDFQPRHRVEVDGERVVRYPSVRRCSALNWLLSTISVYRTID